MSNDIFEKCIKFTAARDLQAAGMYPYFKRVETVQSPVVKIDGKEKIVEMLQTYWTADNSNILKDTNFEFTKLENGAKITYNWYLSNKYF